MKIAVVGGGASGLIASGFLAKNGADVTLFEKRQKVGRKIIITGKGRCNVTNNCDINEFLTNVTTNRRFLNSALYSFTPQDAMQFFEEIGLKLKCERGNRVFPESDNALEVVDKLLNFVRSSNVNIIFENVVDILGENGEITGVLTEKNEYKFDKVIIATGGVSYPKTGSSGDGYKFAKKFGHTITPIFPALSAIKTVDTDIFLAQGLSLKNVTLTLKLGEKVLFFEQGEMLFTHFGVSGPLVLSASSHIKNNGIYKLFIDLKPALSEKELDIRVLKDFEKNINKNFENSLSELLPKKMIDVVINRSGINRYKKVHLITKEERKKLVNLLKKFEITVLEHSNIDEAIITSGGVNVVEINPKTLESKKISGLYFIGEVLDVDAYTGGFNLQIAWSTGYLVAKNMTEELYEN